MKNSIKQLLFSVLLSCLTIITYGQQRTISGTVMNEQGSPLEGVSYVVKGTTAGGTTNSVGEFSVTVTGANPVIVFSYVGYATQEISVANVTGDLNLVLKAGGSSEMQEVVVTALGIKRESKSLGYAVQEVKGEQLAATRELNVANALTGQVAGLQVARSSNGPGGSSKIILRGLSSLTGDNQPLIVVDGVPINNFTGQTNTDYWNPSLDMGNGLSDLNAEDIASISVLKGPSAAALYGTRAGNGAILITTKTGRKQQGIGITLSSSTGFERPFMSPDAQFDFGQGTNGSYDVLSPLSWGPKIEGQSLRKWDSTMAPLQAFSDNINNFLRTGVVSNQNITFQQQLGGTSVYTSYNRVDNMSMIAGAKLIRNNITTRAVSKFAQDKLTLDAKVQFNNMESRNRPLGGPDLGNNIFALMYNFPRSMDILDFKDYLNPNGTMRWWGSGNGLNPYWTEKNRLNNDVRDRFIMSGSLKYNIAKWLDAEIRGGSDMYTTSTESKVYGGSPLTATGRYSMGKETFIETNYSAMLNARKDNIVGNLGGAVMVGGNLMNQKYSSLSASAGELEVPNLFSLNNSSTNPSVGQGFSQRKINSLYGSVQLNYDGFFFVDAILRNDWSSTLSPANRSFSYPALSSSLVFSDMLRKSGNKPAWLSYGKIRASYGVAGNDLGAYQLYNTYWIGKDPAGITNAGRNSTLYDENVVNELIKNIEFGTELKFFGSRLGIDFTYYKQNATNQLIPLPMDPLSGYTSRIINAGDIQNQGIELVLTGNILEKDDGLNWSTIFNISRNRNKIVELSNALNITERQLGGFDNVRIMAFTGGAYGEIYGNTYRRVEDKTSPYYGQLLLNAEGLPVEGPVKVLGNQLARMIFGWTNNFSYKNVSLSFLIDGRLGGEIFSGTNYAMQMSGTAAATVVNGKRDPFVVDGVIAQTNSAGQITGYTKNTIEVTPQVYWRTTPGNLGFGERNIYDATNIRLRNIQLNYQLPKSFANRIGMQGARVGVSALNVLMLRSHLNGVDPESVFATGTNAIGFENLAAPTSRTIFINFALNF